MNAWMYLSAPLMIRLAFMACVFPAPCVSWVRTASVANAGAESACYSCGVGLACFVV
jgi:hypothetical protein